MSQLARADCLTVALILEERERALAARMATPARDASTAQALSETRRLCQIFDNACGRNLDFTATP